MTGPRDRGHELAYVTQGWGPHDTRWVECFRNLGYYVQAFSLGTHQDAPLPVHFYQFGERLRAAVLESMRPEAPIVAGPLNTVTGWLVDLPRKLIGLSWGYDLQLPQSSLHLAGIPGWMSSLDGLVVDCSLNRDYALSLGLNENKIEVVPWGIDLSTWFQQSPRNGRAVRSTGRRYLSLRRHDPVYRVTDIITAFALVQDVDSTSQLIIGNSGSETETLRRHARVNGVESQVRFVGWSDERKLGSLLVDADLYISAAEFDGSSVTLLEAMAVGVPVAVTDIPGNLEWISDALNGQVFPLGNTDALSEKMLCDCSAMEEQALAAQRTVLERADWLTNQRRVTRLLS